MGVATISVNPKSTSRANASVEDDGSSSSTHDCQEEDTDTRKDKRKRVTNLNVNKKVLTETGDELSKDELQRMRMAGDELSLYGGSDLDEEID